MDSENIKSIKHLLRSIRTQLEVLYDGNLQGHCVIASEITATALKLMGVNNIQIIEGWCLFDDASSCSDTSYDPHTWVQIFYGGKTYYLDVTADQFNYYMFPENRFANVIFQEGLPYGMSYDKPLEP